MKLETARFEAMRNKCAELLSLAEKLYGVKINPTIKFDLRGRVAGWAGCKFCGITRQAKDFSLRFNCEIIQGDHFEGMLKNTTAHEIAHLIGFAKPELGAKGHNQMWKRVCLALGGNGARTHNYDVVVRGRWDYITDRGNKVSVTKKYHAYVQAGGTLTFKKGLGQIHKASVHAPSGELKVTPKPDNIVVVRTQPKPAAAPAPKVVTRAPKATTVSKTVVVSKTGELTWAEKVRQLIRAHKPRGISQDTVISLAILELGMTKERARSCVKAHWDKI
jgi:predicted SprT family Zn-dependent metalloprotease